MELLRWSYSMKSTGHNNDPAAIPWRPWYGVTSSSLALHLPFRRPSLHRLDPLSPDVEEALQLLQGGAGQPPPRHRAVAAADKQLDALVPLRPRRLLQCT